MYNTCMNMYTHVYIYIYIEREREIYICIVRNVRGAEVPRLGRRKTARTLGEDSSTPNLPTKITPTKIARLKLSGKSPTGLGIPPLKT